MVSGVIESRGLAGGVAGWVKAITDRQGIRYGFNASHDKANRSAVNAFRGPATVSGLADVLQSPAVLCCQTDLLLAAAGAVRTA